METTISTYLDMFKLYYHEFILYLSSINIQNETKMSVLVGIFLGVILIVSLILFPGDPPPKSSLYDPTSSHSEEEEIPQPSSSSSYDLETDGKRGEEKPVQFNVDKTVKKLETVSKVLGITEEELRGVISKTNEELKDPQKRREMEEEEERRRKSGRGERKIVEAFDEGTMGWIKTFDWILFFCLIGGAIYFINLEYNNAFSSTFASFFPKEAATLGISHEDLARQMNDDGNEEMTYRNEEL